MKLLKYLVPSFDICKKLKEAGFEQETQFYRCKTTANGVNIIIHEKLLSAYPYDVICAAPTLGEIELPDEYVIEKMGGKYFPCGYETHTNSYFGIPDLNEGGEFDLEVDARAYLWLYLNAK